MTRGWWGTDRGCLHCLWRQKGDGAVGGPQALGDPTVAEGAWKGGWQSGGLWVREPASLGDPYASPRAPCPHTCHLRPLTGDRTEPTTGAALASAHWGWAGPAWEGGCEHGSPAAPTSSWDGEPTLSGSEVPAPPGGRGRVCPPGAWPCLLLGPADTPPSASSAGDVGPFGGLRPSSRLPLGRRCSVDGGAAREPLLCPPAHFPCAGWTLGGSANGTPGPECCRPPNGQARLLEAGAPCS